MNDRKPIVLPPGAGRVYAMGPLDAIFKADGDEAAGRYAISEWWLEPNQQGARDGRRTQSARAGQCDAGTQL